jgi:hypothetical protein
MGQQSTGGEPDRGFGAACVSGVGACEEGVPAGVLQSLEKSVESILLPVLHRLAITVEDAKSE